MQKFIYNYKTAAFISGVLTLIAEREINFMFGWFCFVPLFIILQKETAKECFKAGVIFCLTMAIPLFYWMIPGSMRFTGNNILYGLIVFFLSSFITIFPDASTIPEYPLLLLMAISFRVSTALKRTL